MERTRQNRYSPRRDSSETSHPGPSASSNARQQDWPLLLHGPRTILRLPRSTAPNARSRGPPGCHDRCGCGSDATAASPIRIDRGASVSSRSTVGGVVGSDTGSASEPSRKNESPMMRSPIARSAIADTWSSRSRQAPPCAISLVPRQVPGAQAIMVNPGTAGRNDRVLRPSDAERPCLAELSRRVVTSPTTRLPRDCRCDSLAMSPNRGPGRG